jgi:hypothetical protein
MTPAPTLTSTRNWHPAFAALAAMALAYALFIGRGGPYPIPLALLALALVAAGAAIARGRPVSAPKPRRLVRLLSFGLAVQIALLFVWPLTNPLELPSPTAYAPFWAGLAVVAGIAASPIVGVAHDAWWRLVALAGLHLVLGLWVIAAAPPPHIDVWVMQVDGSRALVEGVNPYLPIYPNLHGEDSPFYGPGLVVDGELTIGFPYPPLSLVLVVPGELLGDPRFVHLIAIGVAALVMAAGRPGPVASGAALLYLFTPWTFIMVVGAWTEPLVVLAIATTVLAAVRAPRLLGLAVGLLIAVKQYLILGLPLALLLLASGWRRRLSIAWQSLAVATLIMLPFLIWDPGAFLWSTVGSLAGQAFRPDSLSYLAILPGDWGPRLSVIGFLLLAPALALVAWRAPRSPAAFAASLAFLLLVFFAFSRQGSANYHYAVIGALCCAIAATEWRPHKGVGVVAGATSP